MWISGDTAGLALLFLSGSLVRITDCSGHAQPCSGYALDCSVSKKRREVEPKMEKEISRFPQNYFTPYNRRSTAREKKYYSQFNYLVTSPRWRRRIPSLSFSLTLAPQPSASNPLLYHQKPPATSSALTIACSSLEPRLYRPTTRR